MEKEDDETNVQATFTGPKPCYANDSSRVNNVKRFHRTRRVDN